MSCRPVCATSMGVSRRGRGRHRADPRDAGGSSAGSSTTEPRDDAADVAAPIDLADDLSESRGRQREHEDERETIHEDPLSRKSARTRPTRIDSDHRDMTGSGRAAWIAGSIGRQASKRLPRAGPPDYGRHTIVPMSEAFAGG